MADSVALAVRDSAAGRTRKPRAGSPRAQADADDAILKEARDRWNRCDEAEDAQRTSILNAKKFRAGDQWPDAIKRQREGAQAITGQAAQPPRPCLTIDRLSQPVRQVSNQIKGANFAIDVLPNGMGADTETADMMKGYLRYVQNRARGESPVEWAADSAIEGGIGWFRIRTEYVTDVPTGGSWDEISDQELRIERIANNLSVYCDPSASKPTRSDAQFLFVTEDISKDDFERLYGQDKLPGVEEFASTGDMKGWVSNDSVRIAEYWRVRYDDEKWIKTATGAQRVEEYPKGTPATERRTVKRPVVEGFKMSAADILERWHWVGSRIPLIPILGEELNIDGKPVLRGIIQEGMDAQRMVNYTYSGAIEEIALGVKSKVMVPGAGIEGYEGIWQNANKFNYSYLPYNQFDQQGRPINPPVQPPATSNLQPLVEMLSVSEEAIKATTGIYAESLGESDPRHKSGRAIQALQGQSDLGSSNYPNNVSRALIYAGELMIEIMPKITRPGQMLQILGMDDEPQQVIVGQPFVPGAKGQGPQPVDQSHEAFQKGLAKFYDLTKGRYAVTVSVGKANATKREEGAAAMGELIPHLPPEQQMVIMPDYVEQLSFPGAHKIAEKLRKSLPPQLQDHEEGGLDPEKMAMQQQIQQLQQALDGKMAEEQAKQQAQTQRELAKAQTDAQTQLQKAQLDAETRIKVAEISANAGIAEADIKAGSEDLDRRLKVVELFLTANQEHRLDEQAHLKDVGLTAMEHSHEATQNELDRQHEAQMAQLGHEQALEQGQQAADLAPQEPASGV